MDAYIARQPIFNKKKQIFGYELLFRSNATEDSFSSSSGDKATSHVVMESFNSHGVDSITGGKPAFINFTSRLLLENTATLFPKETLIVEILETVEPTPEIIEACRVLHKSGYKLAMDDFVYRPELQPLINMSKIIKFDFLASKPDEITDMIKKARLRGKWLLAEKIETNEVFDLAVTMGFKLFQGYFFSKPVTVQSKVLSPLKSSYISLMKEASMGENIDAQRVAKTIREDVALSFKLLKLVNSAYYGFRKKISDVSRAVAIIGTNELRKWVLLIALMGLSSDKPDEVIRMSMVRGKFLENMNAQGGWVRSDDDAFQAGLFSLLNVLVDMPMGSVLEGMSLAKEVSTALIDNSGPLHSLLELVKGLELGDWGKVDLIASQLNINAELISDVYLDAVKWCDNLTF